MGDGCAVEALQASCSCCQCSFHEGYSTDDSWPLGCQIFNGIARQKQSWLTYSMPFWDIDCRPFCLPFCLYSSAFPPMSDGHRRDALGDADSWAMPFWDIDCRPFCLYSSG